MDRDPDDLKHHPTRDVSALAKRAATIDGLIELAKAGDHGAAKDLVTLFAYRQLHTDDLGRQRIHPPALLDYLAECFNDILRGKPAAEALRLVSGAKGRPELSLGEKEEQIRTALAVVDLMRTGQTLESAVEAIADERHISPSSAKKAYLKYATVGTKK